jgi:hypothetical protein
MAIPSFLCENECWILRRKNESSIESAEIKFLWALKGCTLLDHIRNGEETGGGGGINQFLHK